MHVCEKEGYVSPCGVLSYGRLVPDGDPILEDAPDGVFRKLSKEEEVALDVVEEATKVPGEKRITTRSKA